MASSVYELSKKVSDSIINLYHDAVNWFLNNLFKKPSTILFLGIDNAGKTTLVLKLKNNANHVYLPTKHPQENVVKIGNLRANVIDIGGHRAVRIAWKDFFHNIDGIVFIVDAGDKDRYAEVKEAWKTVLELDKEVPIVVLMNKIDVFHYTPEQAEADIGFRDTIETAIGIRELRNEKQPINIVYLSIKNEDIYQDKSPLRNAFKWLGKMVNQRDEENKKTL